MSATADAKLRIGADVGPARAAVRGLQGDMGNLNGVVKTGQERIEKLATAVTGTSSVLGGMGAKAGAAAGAVSNLAMAFLAGGPLLAGMALATTAASVLANGYLDAAAAADELARKSRDTLAKALRDAEQAAKDARFAVIDFGKSAEQVAIDQLKREIDRNKAQLAAAENIERAAQRSINRVQKRLGFDLPDDPIEAAEALKAARAVGKLGGVSGLEVDVIESLVGNLARDKAILETMPEVLRANRRELQALLDMKIKADDKAAADEKAKAAKKAAAVKIKDTGSDVIRDRTRQGISEARLRGAQERAGRAADADAFAAAELDDIMREVLVNEDRGNRERAKAAIKVDKDKEKERIRIAKEAAKERERIAKQEMDNVHQLASQTMGFLASVSMQLFDQTLDVIEQLAAGQEVAFAKIAASFIRSIGTQITGIGLRSTAEGLALAATLLMPGGQVNGPAVAAHLAIGTTLTGVGAQMAVGGAVTQGLLSRGSASGGDGALAGGSLSPRESSGGGGGGFGGGGDITINFNGGTQLGDPTERAVRLARDQRRAGRNVYIPPGT